MILQENWHKTLDCFGHHEVYCKGILTERFVAEGINCEIAIMENKTKDITQYCEFAIVHKENVLPTVHNLGNNRVLIENPQEEEIYSRCADNSKKTFLTQSNIAEIVMECFCAIISETFTTTLMTTDNCVVTPDVKLYDPMNNIIFLALLLNKTTMEQNVTYNIIPQLDMPKLINDFTIDDDNHLLNLKNVLQAHKTAYYNTALNTLNRHENMVQSFTIFKLCTMLTPILGVIIFIFIICFCVRMKNLGQLVSLLSISKTTTALPIYRTNYWKEEFDIFTSVCTLILLLIYLILQYYKFFERVQKTISLPFNECVSVSSPPSYKIVLYLSNFNTYCYLYIAEVMKYPERIVTQATDTELYLTFHSNYCNSYVTLNYNDITLLFKKDSFNLPNAIGVPYILRHTVRTILASDNQVDLLIGSGSHFRVLPISSMDTTLVSPVQDDEIIDLNS